MSGLKGSQISFPTNILNTKEYMPYSKFYTQGVPHWERKTSEEAKLWIVGGCWYGMSEWSIVPVMNIHEGRQAKVRIFGRTPLAMSKSRWSHRQKFFSASHPKRNFRYWPSFRKPRGKWSQPKQEHSHPRQNFKLLHNPTLLAKSLQKTWILDPLSAE